MSKKIINLEKNIMTKVKSSAIAMKPRWYFILGSLLMGVGLIGFSIEAIFLTNLIFFLLRRHGPMREYKLQLILNNFPWWIPLLAIIGITIGIWSLKKYDFSYKKNFYLITIGFVLSIIVAAFIINLSGLNDTWFRRGPMRSFYQRLENKNFLLPTKKGNQREGQRN